MHQGLSDLCESCSKGDQHRVGFILFSLWGRTFLDRGGITEIVDPNTDNRLVHLAAESGNDKIITVLFHNGANVSTPNRLGKTPLHVACTLGHSQTVETLLDFGAYRDTNDRDYVGLTPLHLAIRKCSDLSVSALFHHHPLLLHPENTDVFTDANARTWQESTPLLMAVGSGHRQIVHLLLTNGANMADADSFGNQPLHIAVQHGYPDIVEDLLLCRADVNAKTFQGSTPLLMAVEFGNGALVHRLLSLGANVNDTDSFGAGPLHRAVQYGRCDIVGVLLRYCAGVDDPDSCGSTPLHHACFKGCLHCVTSLIMAGADRSRRDYQQMTPRMIAERGRHWDIAARVS